MNPSGIEWTDFTWNPVTGCIKGCPYCYARGIAKRFYPQGFEPTFHEDRLVQPANRKKPAKIFTCSMGELFGEWVPDEWIHGVLDAMKLAPQHTYQLLTKNPSRLNEFWFNDNIWAGATITDQSAVEKTLRAFRFVQTAVRFISLEPLLGPVELPDNAPVEWVIVGAMTGPLSRKNPTDPAWVQSIINWSRANGVPCFLKDNLGWPIELREFPEVAP